MNRFTNRLSNEKSPYLLQHANNPVDWFPWSDEAFKKAKDENKPIFLSIGYSTCHWCHVMEHESFEDEKVAGLMNDSFVSIKVDREERPDIDGIYMTVCQMLTGSGGWPMTIIMTPEKKPFFAGTYFPKETRFGRTGLLELLPKINELWKTKKEEILKSSEEILTAIKKSEIRTHGQEIGIEIFDKAYNEFLKRFDKVNGGFGNSPKFPTPHNLIFLLRYWKRKKEPIALEMVEKTLLKMRLGGIYDHIGFGFHRYSTDSEWLVPHFEKMLYDQAQLVQVYIEVYQITQNDFYKNTAEEILSYVLRDMTSPDGAFYSAEDADSEGEEGKFYLWDSDELKQILDEDEIRFVTNVFNIEPGGNWIDHVNGIMNGTNILHLKNSVDESADELNLTPVVVLQKIEIIRKKLFIYREKRIHPYKDDKILTDWNSLMISAFAKAYQVFDEEKYLKAAEKAVNFILNNLTTNDGKLLHRYREGEAVIPANIDDYAFLISSLLDLYEASFNIEFLKSAIQLNKDFITHFWDKENGGFFFASDESEEILIRQKEIYDGAIPSGNSVAILNLIRIGKITSNSEFESMASEIGKIFAHNINSTPIAFTQNLTALDYAFGPSYEIVIAGDDKADNSNELIKTIRKNYFPNKTIMFNPSQGKDLTDIAPFASNYKKIEDKTAVYICQDYSCKQPVLDISSLKKMLEEL
jgi:hypothetical protein